MGQSRRIIECATCHQQRPHCAKGMCRPCYAREYDKTYVHKTPQYQRVARVTFDCERCGASVTKTAGRGSLSHCGDCTRYFWGVRHRDRLNALGRARRAANPEQHRERDRRERLANPAPYRERSRKYRLKHIDQIRERERAYDAARAERKREYARQWQKDNPARHAANERARRAKQAGLFVEYVHPLVVLELHDGLCGICGEDVDPGNFHVDHIEPLFLGGEHSYSNTQPSHPVCNMRKGWRQIA